MQETIEIAIIIFHCTVLDLWTAEVEAFHNCPVALLSRSEDNTLCQRSAMESTYCTFKVMTEFIQYCTVTGKSWKYV